MAYYQTSCASYGEIKTFIESTLETDELWTMDGDVLVNGDFAIQFNVDFVPSRLQARIGLSSVGGVIPAPVTSYYCALGQPGRDTEGFAPTWPCEVRIFAFGSREVFVTAVDLSNRVMHISFGHFVSPQLAGDEGQWVSGCTSGYGSEGTAPRGVSIGTALSGPTSQTLARCVSPMPFWGEGSTYFNMNHPKDVFRIGGSFVTALTSDGTGGITNPGGEVGVATRFYDREVYDAINPSNWNSQAVLLPYRLYVNRVGATNMVSLVAEFENLRKFRITNNQVGDIVEHDGDSWMVFPAYAKSLNEIDASNNPAAQLGWLHSGTHGFAIRYEGP